MSDRELAVAVVGATGALGTQLLSVLADSPLGVRRLVPVASVGSATTSVAFRGENVLTTDLGSDALQGAELIFFAGPTGLEPGPIEALRDEGSTVIDLAGAWPELSDAPLVALAAGTELLADVRDTGLVQCPHPLAIALAALLAPLRVQNPVGLVRGQALLPAASAGQAAVAEFSSQVVAMFNAQEPPRSVFPHGLAFDLLPTLGDLDDDGWTILEHTVARQTASLVGLSREHVGLGIALAPLFAGMSVALQLEWSSWVGPDELRKMLEEAELVRLVDGPALMPRRHVGALTPAVGRIRADPAGRGVHLWMSADPQRLAAANAVGIAVELEREDLL